MLVTETSKIIYVSVKLLAHFAKHSGQATLVAAAIAEVRYYGASVVSAEQVATVADAMQTVFGQARAVVGHDLLAAARALPGRQPGFAAILGTGTNSCEYDGERITHNVDSLGYFSGDEGSGAFLGKAAGFRATYGLERDAILACLYNQPFPNRFLASFARFANDHHAELYCQQLVAEAFALFFRTIIAKYAGYQAHTFNCVESVGYRLVPELTTLLARPAHLVSAFFQFYLFENKSCNFRAALTQAAAAHGMTVGKIISSPIDDLVSYHPEEYKNG